MIEVLFALGPIFLLIILGFVLRRKKWVDEGFWAPAQMLTYFVFFPALLVKTTSTAKMGDIDIAPLAFSVVLSIVCVAAIGLKSKSLVHLDNPSFTSFFQGTIRFNTYVAIAAASALWGQPGLVLISVCVAFGVPFVNVLCVVVMETYGAKELKNDDLPRLKPILKSVFKNPLILACILGMSMNALNVTFPPIAAPFIEILARAALPIGLLCVGAGLSLSSLHKVGHGVVYANLLKLVILPLVTYTACTAFDVQGLTRDICVFFAGLPVAAASYVLARQMGGNTEMMAAIVTTTTLFSMLTLPAIILILSWL